MVDSHLLDSFLETLEKSRLLSPEQVAGAVERLGLREPSSAKDVARALVARGLLTRFQAERLLRGRSRGFFIDRYKVLEILGSGGMGWIYIAEETGTGHRVALKVLSENYREDPGMLARLKLEAKAGAMLEHPNIVRTERIGHTGAIDYMVMEFVEGISLRELLARLGPPHWPQACDFIRQAAAGLHHAHRQGLVHRDVKPANFLVGRDGTLKVLDFGLALVGSGKEDEFSLAMIFGHDCLGTADYIAPEQSLDSLHVDARADIYSLGCTLYHTVSGVVPFPYDSAARKVEAQRTEQPRRLNELVPEIPAGLTAVVERMMAKDPEERFPSAAAVCRALEPFAQRRPVEFDFDAILAERAKEARQRQKAMQRSRPRPENSSVAARGFESSLSGGSAEALIETAVRGTGDTQPVDQSGPAEPISRDGAAATAASGLVADGAQTGPGRAPVPERRSLETGESNPSLSRTAWLVSTDPAHTIPLTKDRIVIGRDAGCDVRLSDGAVSSRHCELRFEGDWWTVVDLDSKNGVQVNGAAVKDQMLWPGDRLTIAGLHHFRLVDGTLRPRRRWAKRAWLVGAATAAALLAGLAAWLTLG